MDMVHYCHEIHFNTLFRNKTFMLIMLRQVSEWKWYHQMDQEQRITLGVGPC